MDCKRSTLASLSGRLRHPLRYLFQLGDFITHSPGDMAKRLTDAIICRHCLPECLRRWDGEIPRCLADRGIQRQFNSVAPELTGANAIGNIS